jgi:hypothetical protein
MTDPKQAARLDGILARYGAGLTPADLPPGTAEDLLHYRSTEAARGRVLQVWCKAIAAAKRHPAGLGIASDATEAPVYVAVCRAGRWSRVLQIDRRVDSMALAGELMRLSSA